MQIRTFFLISFLLLGLATFCPPSVCGQDIKIVDLVEVIEKKQNRTNPFVPAIRLEKGLNATERAVWQLYANKRREFLKDNYPSTSGIIVPTLDEEVYARVEWLSKYLKPLKSRFTDEFKAYLEGLERVHGKGFMREYVWTFHHQEKWKQPGDLKLEEFNRWKRDELAGHQSQARAELVMVPPRVGKGIRILLDRKLMETQDDGAILLHYALQRFEYRLNHEIKLTTRVNQLVIPGFEEEVEARTGFVAEYDNHMKGSVSAKLKKYLLDLKKVAEAGMMSEYAWTFYRQKKWKQPADLKLETFRTWSRENIKEHEPLICAALSAM